MPFNKIKSEEEEQELRQMHTGNEEDFEADAEFDEKFGEVGDDLVDFFDFTEAIQVPDSTITP